MPPTDTVSCLSGRNSRASETSRATAGSRLVQQALPYAVAGQPGDTVNNTGVLSMLKTSTDTGDIGALSFNKTRLPIMPRPTAQPRRGHMSRLSGPSNYPADAASSHYAPSASTGRRGSLNSMQSMIPYVADTQDPTQVDVMKVMPYDMPDRHHELGVRSYSLTMHRSERPLSHYRSQASVKSQGHEPMRNLAPPVSAMSDYRSAYGAPGNRAGYRPPSPAFSDCSQGHPVPPPQIHTRGGHRMPRPPPRSYYSDYGSEYRQDVRSLQPRPPSRGLPDSPVFFYDEQQRHHPGPWRPDAPPTGGRSHGQYTAYRNVYASAGESGQYTQSGIPQRIPYHPMHGQGNRRHPPPVNPFYRTGGATSMSHYAGRSIQRSATPRSDSEPPSSDPPSSGTMHSSSNPSTPQDGTPIHVMINSISGNPDLSDSTSEPVLPAHYIEYAEEIMKGVNESEADCHTTSIPPSGFVQRVRAMLESRAAVDRAMRREAGRLEQQTSTTTPEPSPDSEHQNATLHQDIHELATETSPRVTMVDDYVPIELPASPLYRPAELDGLQNEAPKTLTRALVRAVLSPTPSKDEDEDEDVEEDQSHSQGNSQTHNRSRSNMATQQDHIDEKTQQDTVGFDESKSIHGPDSYVGDSSKHTSKTGSTCRFSDAEYALRFSVPVDTTALDETYSNDPFALDADTITAQKQNTKQSQFNTLPQITSQSYDPVSPLQAGEDASRYSAVSLLQERTVLAEKSLQLSNLSSQRSDGQNMGDTRHKSMPGASPEDVNSSSVPRAPRGLSKSLQITLPANSSSNETTNRHSLPPDLSQTGETTIDSPIRLGDIAKRVSVPTHWPFPDGTNKIASVSVSGGPGYQQEDEAESNKKQRQRGKSIITFDDEVVPLESSNEWSSKDNISDARNAPQAPYSSPCSKPCQIPWEGRSLNIISSPAEVENTTGLRFSGINFIRKYASTHPSRPKEESQKTICTNVAHISKQQHQQPVLPARIAAVKAMQERRMREAEVGTSGKDTETHCRILSESRDLPSLNFSYMDLFDKLNDALEVRSSDSIDIIRRRDFSGICYTSPQRPVSANTLRERYTSFFEKPEEVELESTVSSENATGEEESTQTQATDPNGKAEGEAGKWNGEAVEKGDDGAANTTTSPSQDFLSVASQISRLSIPSVSALTDRLSDILSGKVPLDNYLLSTEQDVQNTIEDIHQIGQGQRGQRPRPQTMLSNRTSAGFRTLAERAEEFVRNGYHDSLIVRNGVGINKELPPLPQARSSTQCLSSPLASSGGRGGILPNSTSAPSDLRSLPSCPPSAMIRSKSPETEEEVRLLLTSSDNPLARKTKRSLVVSSPSSRPWNLDENYPWASSNIAMDLAVPKRTHQRDSLLNEVMRDRGTRSLDVTNPSSGNPTIAIGDSTGQTTTTGIDVGSFDTSINSAFSVNTEQCAKYGRKHGTQNIIGSITKKMGLSRSEEGGTTKSMPASLIGLYERPHDPGERYPSTGLTPPTALNLDEVRSFFSDDSSETEHRRISRKRRLASISKIRGGRTRPSTSHTQSLDGLRSTTYDAGSINERSGLTSTGDAAQMFDATGMGKAEFTFKRFGEKLRSL